MSRTWCSRPSTMSARITNGSNRRFFRGSPTRCQFATALFRWTSEGWTGGPCSSSVWTRSATIRSAKIAEAGDTHPASGRLTGATRAAERMARSRVWTRELAKVAREAETVGHKEKAKGTKARATLVAKLDRRPGSATHATSTQSPKRARERWREWWVGTIWNVGHVSM